MDETEYVFRPPGQPVPAPEPVAWMLIDAYGGQDDITHEDPMGDLPEGWTCKPLYTHPPQHPTETETETETEDEYGSEADTEELLRVGAMPEPLRLAAQLEKTMQWPLHGIAADCLRRMHNEAQRKPLTDEEIDKVTDAQWAQNNHKPIYAANRAYARAIERAHGIGSEE